MQFKDQLNRKINIDKFPKRIISLVPSQTELLVDLGLKENVVGITKFCVHPKTLLQEKQIVGGTKGIRMDRIKALNPDIILCNKEENTREMIAELEKDFRLHISDIHTIEDTYELILQYGNLFDVKERALEINKNIQQQIVLFRNFIKDKPKLKVAYFIWRKPWMVVGRETFVNHLLEMNNFENVYASIPRYPEVDIEQLRPMDFLLLSSEPFPFAEKHRQELLPYVNNTDIIFVDGEFFSWYGSRLAAAFKYFKKLRAQMDRI